MDEKLVNKIESVEVESNELKFMNHKVQKHKIPHVNTAKYLGMTLDTKLK